MASSFISTIQNLAGSITSDKNGFTWDSAIRKFQYAVAGITIAALSIYETTTRMQCSTPNPTLTEHYYASSYCYESTWYVVDTVNKSFVNKVPYDDYVRDFKWYLLIPPILTIISAVLYGSLVDSFVIQALRSAEQIKEIWGGNVDDSANLEGTAAVNNSMVNMAIRARVFSEIHMHYRRQKSCCCGGKPAKTSNVSPSSSKHEDCDQTELFSIDHYKQDVVFSTSFDRMGDQTALYYQLYLGMCVIINAVAFSFMNPYFFYFPKAIACQYPKEDLTLQWSVCSFPGYRYSSVAVIIIMANHVIGCLVAFLSFFYLNYYIPNEILKADTVITSYTRNPKQQEKILQCWRNYGKGRIKNLTATTRLILALVYQNINRTLCYNLVLAMVDIEKDKDAIESDLPNLIKQIVDIDEVHACTFDAEREDKINEIRETILNPVGIDQVKSNIQKGVLMKLISAFLDNPSSTSELFQARQIHRITGVQLPNLSNNIKDKFSALVQEKKESDFVNAVEYYRFLGALYDLSKSRQVFDLLKPMDIGKISDSEFPDCISDNGHEKVGDQEFDAVKAFDASGYCWRSSDATSYNWIKRTWEKDYSVKLIAIQGSHINEKATPIHFDFIAKLEDPQTKAVSWVEVSESFRSYDWLKDEWRIFSLGTRDKVGGIVKHPRTRALQINIFKNGGADYFEIQKIKIFGSE